MKQTGNQATRKHFLNFWQNYWVWLDVKKSNLKQKSWDRNSFGVSMCLRGYKELLPQLLCLLSMTGYGKMRCWTTRVVEANKQEVSPHRPAGNGKRQFARGNCVTYFKGRMVKRCQPLVKEGWLWRRLWHTPYHGRKETTEKDIYSTSA